MLWSSFTLGTRQSLYPAKVVAFSVATWVSKAPSHVYTLCWSWIEPSSLFFSHTRQVLLSVIVPSPLSV